MTIWRMRIACWIPKATEKLIEYVILIAFPLQQWLQEPVSMLHYTYIACLVCALCNIRFLFKVSLCSPGKFDVVSPTYFRNGSRLKLLQHVGEASTVCVLTGLQVKLWTFPSSALFIKSL